MVFFDPAMLTDHVSFERPWALAAGVQTAGVKGAILFDAHETTVLDPGRNSRRALRAGPGPR